MSNSRPNLPDFTDPPVIEVALSVQFDPLAALRTPQIGLLWVEFRDRFPRMEEHPPRNPVIERFGVQRPPKASVQLETKLPVPRCWFLNETGTELIQVQQDRFVHNWRKVGDGDEYPRYEHVRRTFSTELDAFRKFLTREHLGELAPNQCEVTYVNHIVSGEGWQRHGQLGEVVTVWASRYSDAFLSELEDVNFAVRYIIPDSGGNPLGRLHVRVDSAYRTSDNKPIFVMKLTARGRPDGEGIEGVFSFLDLGREWIVRGFTSVTSPQMHEIWGRRDEH